MRCGDVGVITNSVTFKKNLSIQDVDASIRDNVLYLSHTSGTGGGYYLTIPAKCTVYYSIKGLQYSNGIGSCTILLNDTKYVYNNTTTEKTGLIEFEEDTEFKISMFAGWGSIYIVNQIGNKCQIYI